MLEELTVSAWAYAARSSNMEDTTNAATDTKLVFTDSDAATTPNDASSAAADASQADLQAQLALFQQQQQQYIQQLVRLRLLYRFDSCSVWMLTPIFFLLRLAPTPLPFNV